MTRTILLAAGRGHRMGAVTAAQPKCCVEVAGRALLDWQRAALAAAGCDPLLAVGGWGAQHLADRGVAVRLNRRWAESNMVVSLACARDWLAREVCIVHYGDIAVHPAHLRALCAAPAEAAIAITVDLRWRALWTARFRDPLLDAEALRLEGARVARIGGRARSLDEIDAQYMGLLRFTPHGWDVVESLLRTLPQAQIDRLDMTALLDRLIARGVVVRAVPVSGAWCEFDRPADLALAERALAAADAGGARWSHDWRDASGDGTDRPRHGACPGTERA